MNIIIWILFLVPLKIMAFLFVYVFPNPLKVCLFRLDPL